MILVNGGIHNKSEEKLSLSYRENTVTFYYSALKLEAGSLLNYAYMLEGFDKNWIDAGSNKRVAYSNLPTGESSHTERRVVQERTDQGGGCSPCTMGYALGYCVILAGRYRAGATGHPANYTLADTRGETGIGQVPKGDKSGTHRLCDQHFARSTYTASHGICPVERTGERKQSE